MRSPLLILLFLFLAIRTTLVLGNSLYIDVSAVLLDDSEITASEVQLEFEKANKVFAQCGLEIRTTLHPISLDKWWPSSLNGKERDFLKLLKKISTANELLPVKVLFIKSFTVHNRIILASESGLKIRPDTYDGTGLAYDSGFMARTDTDEMLLNSIWLTKRIFDPDYTKSIDPSYSVLAHEIGHLLLGSKHLARPSKNLMNSKKALLNSYLDNSQCNSIRKSGLVRNSE